MRLPIIIDVIISCYQAQDTLERAVESVVHQPYLGKIWLVDDGSPDGTWQEIQRLHQCYPHKIQAEQLPCNRGVAVARNWGAMLSQADFIAFLDADDSYQSQVLEACARVFQAYSVGVIRLPMIPFNLPERFATHPHFSQAWRVFEMSGAGNTVFYRPYFLALGGFDTQALFKKYGGEDGALGLATVETAQVATLFDQLPFGVGVNYYCHEGMHVAYLLEAILFGEHQRLIQPEELAQANQSTQTAIDRVQLLKQILAQPTGKLPIYFS